MKSNCMKSNCIKKLFSRGPGTLNRLSGSPALVSTPALVSIILLVLLTFASCASREQVILENNGSGRAEVYVKLHPWFVAYLDDIVAGFSSAEPGTLPLFDIPLLREEMEALPGLELTKVESRERSELKLAFTFLDAAALFPESVGTPSPYRYRHLPDGSKEALFTLSLATWPAVRSFVPMSQEQGVETFGPQEPPYTKPEYIDLISFLLEEYAEYDAIGDMIRKQKVSVIVEVEGQIISAEGFQTFSGSRGEAQIPLLDLVTLSRPVVLKLRWR